MIIEDRRLTCRARRAHLFDRRSDDRRRISTTPAKSFCPPFSKDGKRKQHKNKIQKTSMRSIAPKRVNFLSKTEKRENHKWVFPSSFSFFILFVTIIRTRGTASAASLTVGAADTLLSFFLRPNDIRKRTADDQHDHTDDNRIRQCHKHSPIRPSRSLFSMSLPRSLPYICGCYVRSTYQARSRSRRRSPNRESASKVPQNFLP